MSPEEMEKVNHYADEIAKILYADSDPTTLESLEAIEITVRQKILERVSPRVGIFLSKAVQAQQRGELAP